MFSSSGLSYHGLFPVQLLDLGRDVELEKWDWPGARR
jgi:hypothetical protein